MIALAVTVAILDNGRVLLTRREDFEVWCLPGGGVEDGESAAAATLREVKEGTGLDVELTSLVGIYSRLGGGLSDVHSVLYTARPAGDELRVQPGETLEVAYFPFDGLPGDLMFTEKKRIHDAVSHSSGLSVRQEIVTAEKTRYTRKELYELRDRSGMSRHQFYFQRFAQAEIREVVEVGDE